jgi:uncharacterized protein YoxC
MNTQELFYLLGSIAFGIAVLFVLTLIITIVLIKQRIDKVAQKIDTVSGEIQGLVSSGRRYTETMGKGFMASLALKIIKSFMTRR